MSIMESYNAKPVKARIKEDPHFDSVPVYSQPYDPNPVGYLKTGSVIEIEPTPNSEGTLQSILYFDPINEYLNVGYILKTRIELMED